MKKIGYILLIIAMVFLVAGCGGKEKLTEGENKQEQNEVEVKPINLRFATYLPEGLGAWDPVTKYLTNELEKRTDGRVKTEIFWGSSTGKVTEFFEQLRSGVVDMAFVSLTYYSSELPLSTIANESGFTNSPDAHLNGFRKVMSLPEVQKEWQKAGVRLWAGAPTGPNVFGTNKPITKIEDFKGLKMRAAGLERAVTMLGASPQAVIGPEQYEAMQTGVINSWTTMPIDAVPIYGLHEVTENIYPSGMGTYAMTFFVFSNRAYEQLPEDIRKIVDEVGRDAEILYLDSLESEEDKTIKMMVDAGVNIESLPQGLEQKIQEILYPASWEEWVKSMDGKGLSGQEVYENFKKGVDEFVPTKVRKPWWERLN